MKMFNRIAIAAALVAPMVAAPASAQSWKWDLGMGVGYTMFTSSVDDEGLSVAGIEGLKFDNGARLNTRLGYWFSPRVGLRANATYQDGKVETDEGTRIAENINMWSGTGDLLFRLGAPNETWMGSEFLPYIALGLGGKWINPATDDQTCDDGEEEFSCAYMGGTGTALGEKKQLSGLVGLGADWRLSPRFAVNLEINDRMYKPPFFAANLPTAGGSITLPNGDERVSKLTHEFGADLGLKFLFGLAPAPVVVIAPRPTPPPPPPPPAPPTPVAPREDAITVCVIDPTAPNGIRMQSATFLPASGDTMVMVNGNRVRLNTTVGNVMVARNADWYVRGEPLTINVGTERMQYMTYQGAQQIDADRLSYLGTANGYPVYANRDEVADINSALADLRAAQAGRDLGEILAQRKDLRDELDDVNLLYVPLAPTGCVFQTVQMMQQVRKGK